MERTSHILLAAEGANQFAIEMGVEFAPDEYFFTEHRWQQLLKAREAGVVELDHTADEGELVRQEAEDGRQESEPGAAATGDSSARSGQTTEIQNPKSKIQNPSEL
jgi:isoaspartyl peptidase/L-asparaginase-like protein (Ntn-hydrolase superfamily)